MQYRSKSFILAFALSVFTLTACSDVQAPLETDILPSFSKDKDKDKGKGGEGGGEVGTMAEYACVDVGGTGDFYCEPYPCAANGGAWQVDENGNVVAFQQGLAVAAVVVVPEEEVVAAAAVAVVVQLSPRLPLLKERMTKNHMKGMVSGGIATLSSPARPQARRHQPGADPIL